VTGELPPALAEAPPLPEGGLVVWRWYVELASGRRTSGFGPSPLVWADVDAFFRLRRVQPRAWELDTILAIDAAFLRVLQERT
jgi:hypothetical protein